jgi:predicted ester cyclase
MERVWQKHDIDAIDILHSPDFIDCSPSGRNTDNIAYKTGVTELFKAFPDFFARTDDLVIDPISGKVAIRWCATGTHSAEFFGIPATGKKIKFNGIEILRIESDRIVERWGEWDGISIWEQLK